MIGAFILFLIVMILVVTANYCMLRPSEIEKFFTSSAVNDSFEEELRASALKTRKEKINELVKRYQKRIPKELRLNAKRGCFSYEIWVNADDDFKEDVVKKLVEWAAEKRLNVIRRGLGFLEFSWKSKDDN